MQITEINKIFINRLKDIYSQNEINAIFGILAEHFLKYATQELLLKKQEIIQDECRSKFFSALSELIKHKPVQYITAETGFYGMTMKVNEHVLIPRPETEELVDWVIQDLKREGQNATPQMNILDIGTGSGCIAIALKKNMPDAQIYATDISEQALKKAKENAEINKTQIIFFESDMLNLQYPIPDTQYSIIVSNPPYVTASDKEKMKKNVLDYEPAIALFTPEENPLLYYVAIVNFAKTHLKSNGNIYFEINEKFGDKVKQLLAGNGFSDVIVKKDLSGKERMTKAVKK